MLIGFAFTFAAQVSSSLPVPVNEFPATKTDQALTNSISCKPNGSFSVSLRWRFRQGVVNALVKRNGVALPQKEISKLVAALTKATDLLYVQMGCSSSLDAQINVVYVGRESGHPSAMMLPVTVRSNTLELLPTVQVPLLP
jgi:hypothetical protein